MAQASVKLLISFEALVDSITGLSRENKRRLWELLGEQIAQAEDEMSQQTAVAQSEAREARTVYESATFDITQTQTWHLCGTLEVSKPDPEYVVGRNEQGQVITNYAEHVDNILYRRE